MRKFLLYLALIGLPGLSSAQSILVNPAGVPESALNAEDLTREVLIDGGDCSEISNFVLQENPQAAYPNANRSWGYFEKGTSNFPFEKGIVLTSGYATETKGPSSNHASDGGYSWPGNAMASTLAGGGSSNNATVFEFDFIPYGDEISFNYIFASEEYPTFTCSSYNDVFGFIISGPGITNDPGLPGKNIARLPNGLPVTINNVNNDYCGDATYYVPGPFTAIAHGGRTDVLTASSPVIPGQTYRIRLVVSDISDTIYDSAVFLEAGSFNLGSYIMDIDGIELQNEGIICDQESYTLVANAIAPNLTFQWYFNGNIIPGATGQSYEATETGYYSVVLTSDACQTEVGIVIYFSEAPDAEAFTHSECTSADTIIYNLTDFNSSILENPSPLIKFSYYNTENGAETEFPGDKINNFTNYPVSGTVVVYVRVENEFGCFKVVPLTLEVGEGPETTPATYGICDTDGDGIAEFDLTTQLPNLVVGAPTGLTFEFYTDATHTQLIADPSSFTNTSNPQTIYVRISDDNAGDDACISNEILTLEVYEFPELQADEITICDNLNDLSEFIDLTQHQIVVTPGFVGNYVYFEANGTEITTPANYEITASPTVITVLVKNGDGTCEGEEEFTIYFNEAPDVFEANLELCSNDGFAEFHLPDAETTIGGGATGLGYTYYANYNAALNGNPADALPTDFTNTTAQNQTVFVRVENEDGCFNIAELDLTVIDGPDTMPFTSSVCDENGDGIHEFNLVDLAPNLLVGTPTGIQVGYYLDAAATQEIANPATFQNTTNPQTIYLTFSNDEGCISTEELILEVLEFPELQADEITICDNLNDLSEFIDLTQHQIVVTPGFVGSYVYFEANGTEITTPANYEITASPTVITVLVKNGDGTCEGEEEFTIYFNEAPDVFEANLELCSHDGFAEFHLPDAETTIGGGAAGLGYTYYANYNAALNGNPADALPTDFTNTTAQNQTVFVRVENADGCFNIAELDLTVLPGPDTAPHTEAICDDNGDGVQEFNLVNLAPNLLVGTQTGIQIGYYLDAAATQEIANPATFQNTTNPQTIYLAFTNEDGCTTVEELQLVVDEFPEINPDSIDVCDNLHDGVEIIDLTQNQIVTGSLAVNLHYYETIGGVEITNPAQYEVSNISTTIYVLVRNAAGTCEDYATFTINLLESPEASDEIAHLENCSLTDFSTFHLPDANPYLVADVNGLNFSYHLTYDQAFAGTNDLPVNYQNNAQGQIVFVRIENANGCFDIGQIQLSTVLKHEEIPTGLEVCDSPNEVNDGIAKFDLTQMHISIENSLGGTNYTIKYFTSLEDAVAGVNPIENPANFENTTNPQIIYAQASSGQGGCAGVAEFLIEVLPVPEFDLPDYVAFCDYDVVKNYQFFGDFVTYKWIDPNGTIISTSAQVEFTQGGTHILEVTSGENNCPARRSIEVIFDSAPTILDITVDGHTVTVSATGGEAPYQYSYTNGLTWENWHIMYGVEAGIYDLIVKSRYGCISQAKTFGVLGIPNFFSPNGDGINDYWDIRALEAYPNTHIQIFDRYGKMFVDRKMTPGFKWDGKYMGSTVSSGDYWYILTFEDGRKITGHISVRNR